MAIEKIYLDPNAQSYTDNEIVGKLNTATAAISRAGCIDATSLSAVDSDAISEGAANKYDTGTPPSSTDDLTEGSTNKYDTGAPPTAGEMRDAIVGLSDDTREIVISRPTSGQKKIYAIQTHTDGKQEIEQNDTAES